ncbi:MAG TPA: DNA topoisomerase I, partial [Arcobacter sp.]|nr:DNA topoisomerase I [Arcobacter sp.]
IFAGFMKAYTEGSDDPEAVLDGKENILPTIKENTVLDLEQLSPEQNFTKPPARYTEASLVKKLEAEGIGRPSTYAPTISTIQARDYVIKTEDKKLAPAPIGEVVNDFLVEHFPNIVDLGFTASVEEEFDEIAEGKVEWTHVMQEFYGDFVKNVDDKEQNAPRAKFAEARELGVDPKSGKKVFASVGRYGPFVQLGHKDDVDEDGKEIKPRFASIQGDVSVDRVTLEDALVFLSLPRTLGTDENGNDVKVNIGRFGPYVQIKSEYFSLKDDSPYFIELPKALEVVKEQREAKAKALIADFPDAKLQILDGRYGPYVKEGRKNHKLPKGISREELEQVSLDELKKLMKKASTPAKKKTTRKTTAKKTTAKKTTTKKKDEK